MHEIELKFQIPPAHRQQMLVDFRSGPTSPLRLQAHYFDTADGLLARHAMALRLRREGARWVQTLKASSPHSVARLEDNAAVRVARGRADRVPALDVGRHAGSAAHAALAAVLADAGLLSDGHGGLIEVFRTEVDREIRLFRQPDGSVIEAALDLGQVVAGAAVHPLCEIEFEWKAGPLAGLFSLAAEWVQAHGLWLDTVSKAERGHLLARQLRHGPAVKARPPRWPDTGDGASLARAAVAACLAQVLPNASVVAGSAAPGPEAEAPADHVHQLRVGLRRLRTALREMAPLNAALNPGWEAPLAEVFSTLGTARDQQVLQAGTAQALAAAGAPALPAICAQLPAGPDACAQVRSGAFQQALLATLAFSMQAGPAPQELAYDGPPLPALSTRLDQLHRQLRRQAKRFPELPQEQQHATRKQLKRLRYLAEFIAPAYRASRVQAYFDALAPAQEALGDWHDQAVAQAAYRAQAEQIPQAWFAVGWLSAKLPAATQAAHKALRAACKLRPFWHDAPQRKAHDKLTQGSGAQIG